jgi:cytochrome oxidase Cu insertion factor (SCO1/SenC/PrrC family)
MAGAGFVLVLAGVLGYFAVVLFLPAWAPFVRNHAVPNWLLVATGLGLSLVAVRRTAPGAWTPRVLLGVNASLAALFATFLYVMLSVPGASGPTVGAAAPDFALVDQTGRTVRLTDFRGSPLLLVFYRGHW